MQAYFLLEINHQQGEKRTHQTSQEKEMQLCKIIDRNAFFNQDIQQDGVNNQGNNPLIPFGKHN